MKAAEAGALSQNWMIRFLMLLHTLGEKGRSFGQLPVEERWLTIARSLPVTCRDDGGVPASEPVAFLADAGPASRSARKFGTLHCRLTLTGTNGVVGDTGVRVAGGMTE
jgi:hypothetical protein